MEAHNLPPDAPLWLIDGIPASLVGAQPRPQPGESATYALVEAPVADHTLSLSIPNHVERYLALRDRARHAKTLAVETSLTDHVVYSRAIGGYEPLAAVEPGPYDPTGTALWGLIVGVDDSTTYSEALAEFALDIVFIADRSAYPDKAAVRAAHERRGFH